MWSRRGSFLPIQETRWGVTSRPNKKATDTSTTAASAFHHSSSIHQMGGKTEKAAVALPTAPLPLLDWEPFPRAIDNKWDLRDPSKISTVFLFFRSVTVTKIKMITDTPYHSPLSFFVLSILLFDTRASFHTFALTPPAKPPPYAPPTLLLFSSFFFFFGLTLCA